MPPVLKLAPPDNQATPEPELPQTRPSSRSAGRPAAAPPNAQLTLFELSLSELEGHLWEAANILRGPVDAADFKTYIFPLLFFKRISDVYDEELETALAESGGDAEYAQFPENHRFQIPDGCH